MGINGLFPFLRQVAPDLIVTVPLKSFSGSKIAIDTSIYMYKFMALHKTKGTHWLDLFINLIQILQKNNVRPIFIFDGKASSNKDDVRAERRLIQQKIGLKQKPSKKFSMN